MAEASRIERLRARVVVVGAGPAGLAAAVTAADSLAVRGGAQAGDVLVLDENPHPGGQIWRASARRGLHPRAEALAGRARALRVRVETGLSVFDGSAAARTLRAFDPARGVVEIGYQSLVIATGATELFLPFPGWTLPGVTGVGGLQALVKGGFEVRGQQVVVAGSGPLLLAVAASVRAAGAQVLGVIEQAPRRQVRRLARGLWRHPRKLVQGAGLLAALRGVPILHDAWVVEAHGHGRVERVGIADAAGGRRTLDCDLLATGYGLVPAARLAVLLGCALSEDGRVSVDDLRATTLEHVFCAGEPTGIGGVDVALAEGRVAGRMAAGDVDRAHDEAGRMRRELRFAGLLQRAFALRDELRALPDDDTIVCRCEDVPFGAVRTRRDARQAKLETRCGMGPCQGRVCGPALTFLCGFPRDRVRPPLIPVPMAALAVAGSANTSENQPTETTETPE